MYERLPDLFQPMDGQNGSMDGHIEALDGFDNKFYFSSPS